MSHYKLCVWPNGESHEPKVKKKLTVLGRTKVRAAARWDQPWHQAWNAGGPPGRWKTQTGQWAARNARDQGAAKEHKQRVESGLWRSGRHDLIKNENL